MKKQILCLALAVCATQIISAQKKVEAQNFTTAFIGNYLSIQKGIYWGFIDTSGNEVSPFTNQKVDIGFQLFGKSSPFGYGMYVTNDKNLNNNFSIYNSAQKLISKKYIFVNGFQDSISYAIKQIPNPKYMVKASYVLCYINLKGEEIFKPNIELNAFPNYVYGSFKEGLVWYEFKEKGSYGRKFGFLNKSGKVVVKPTFLEVRDFNEGRAIVKGLDQYGSEKWGVIDKAGNLISDLIFTNEPTYFQNNVSVIKDNKNKYGYMNSKGKIFIEPKYVFASSFENGQAIVVEGENEYSSNSINIIDTSGKIVQTISKSKMDSDAPFKFIRDERNTNYNFINIFRDGLLTCRNTENNFYGAIDINGKTIVPFRFKILEPFSCGRAYVETDTQKGFIDKKGDWVFIFTKASY